MVLPLRQLPSVSPFHQAPSAPPQLPPPAFWMWSGVLRLTPKISAPQVMGAISGMWPANPPVEVADHLLADPPRGHDLAEAQEPELRARRRTLPRASPRSAEQPRAASEQGAGSERSGTCRRRG